MKSLKRRILATIAATTAAFTFGVSPAYAYTDNLSCHSYGGKIYLSSLSRMSTDGLYVYASGCGHGYIPGGNWSSSYYNFRDTDAFFVSEIHYCRSQWGYDYVGGNSGRWFWLNSDSTSLSLNCQFAPNF